MEIEQCLHCHEKSLSVPEIKTKDLCKNLCALHQHIRIGCPLTWKLKGILVIYLWTTCLPSLKFVGGNPILSYQLHKLRENDWHTDRLTDMCNAICPSFFEGGHNNKMCLWNTDTPAARNFKRKKVTVNATRSSTFHFSEGFLSRACRVMHAKYEVSFSYCSKVKTKAKVFATESQKDSHRQTGKN